MVKYLLAAGAVLNLFMAVMAAGADVTPAASGKEIKLWATYVPWMMPGAYNSYTGFDLPLGQFSSDMKTAFRQEQEIAGKYGVDGFFVCLSSTPGQKTFDRLFLYKYMLEAAEGSKFYINPCLDRDAATPEECVRDIEHFIKTFGAHRNIYRENGKIVFSTYVMDNMKEDYWKKVKELLKDKGLEINIVGHMTFRKSGGVYGVVREQDILDFSGLVSGLYFFTTPYKPVENNDVLASAAKKMNVPMWGSMSPGYSGGKRLWRNEYYIPAKGFGTAREEFMAGAKHEVSALHLTTWNDHDETTMMPTVFQLDSRCRIANYYKRQLAAGKVVMGSTPEIFIACKVELLLGDDLALSVEHFPVEGGRGDTLKLRAVDEQGKMLAEKILKLDNHKEELLEVSFPGNLFLACSRIRILAEYENVSYALPNVKINASRITNPIVWATPLDRTLPSEALKQIKFEIAVKDHLATGKLKASFTDKISRATIYRNFLPVMSLDGREDNRKFSLAVYDDSAEAQTVDIDRMAVISNKASASYYLKCQNGKITRAGHRYAPFRSFNAGQIFHNSNQGPVLFEVLGAPDKLELAFNSYKCPVKTVSVADVIRNNGVSVTLKDNVRLLVKPLPLEPVPWNTPEAGTKSMDTEFCFADNVAAAPSNSYSVRIELENGKVIWSDLVFPYAARASIADNILLSGKDWDSCFGWNTGKYKYPESAVASLQLNTEVLQVDAFELGGPDSPYLINSTGMDNAMSVACKLTEFNGRKALVLDGDKSYVRFAPRSMMNGSFSFAAWIAPEKCGRDMGVFSDKVEKDRAIVYLKITSDGRLAAEKSTVDRRVEESSQNPWVSSVHVMHQVFSRDKVNFGEWNYVVLVYDLKSMKIYLNGKLSGETPLPPNIVRSNSWPTVGCRSGGDGCNSRTDYFRGKIGAFRLYGYPLRDDSSEAGAFSGAVAPDRWSHCASNAGAPGRHPDEKK